MNLGNMIIGLGGVKIQHENVKHLGEIQMFEWLQSHFGRILIRIPQKVPASSPISNPINDETGIIVNPRLVNHR